MDQMSDEDLVQRFLQEEELGHRPQSQQTAVELVRRTIVALNASKRSSDRVATWMIRLAIVIALLTMVLAVFTVGLFVRGK